MSESGKSVYFCQSAEGSEVRDKLRTVMTARFGTTLG